MHICLCVRVYMLCFVLCVYCVDIDYPIVTSLSATQETAAHPDAAQVEAQKQLEEERLDVCYHTLDAYTVHYCIVTVIIILLCNV